MKKFFLSLAMSLLCMAGFAQEVGSYAYTATGKVKITGEQNLVVNGDFEENTDGWTTDLGTELKTDTFTIIPEYGVDGSSCLYTVAKDNGYKTGSTMMQKIAVQAGSVYYVSYYVKNDASTASSTTFATTTKNYQNVIFNVSGELFNEDGTLNAEESYGKVFTTDEANWTHVEYAFTAPNDGYIFIYIAAPYVGQAFDNFVVKEAKLVPDDREVANIIARIQAYVDNPLFTNAHGDMEDIIAQFNTCVEEDDYETYIALKGMVDSEIIGGFLDENTVNISDRLDLRDFDLATPGSSLGTAGTGVTTLGGWDITWDAAASSKSRWSVKASTGVDPYLTNYLSRSIPYGYNLSKSEISQSINLPKGKYMFTMRLNARRYTNKASNIAVGAEITGLKVFIGKDTVECTNIDTLNMYRYPVYTTLDEDATVNVGFAMDETNCQLLSLDLTELRAIDNTLEDIEAYDNKVNFNNAKKSLADQIATAQSLYDSKEYIFEKALLNDSIVKSQGIYDALTEYTAEYLDSINNQTKRLGRAISYYKKMNAEYLALAAAIVAGNEAVADASITADKSGIVAAINEGQAYYNSLTTESERDSLTLATYANNITIAISTARANSASDDEMYPFVTWTAGNTAYFSSPAADPATTSFGNASMYEETAQFCGHDLNGRFAINTDGKLTSDAEENKGWKLYYSGKNAQFFSILNLKAGQEVKIDWTTNGTLYCVSNNATYTKSDGTEITLVAGGKKDGNIIPASDNTKGLGGSNRTTFTMTFDGSLDFYSGATGKTFNIYYVGINEPKAGITGDVNGDGTVDIADVNAVISVICGGEAIEAADVNGDNTVDIADVNAVIGIICGN